MESISASDPLESARALLAAETGIAVFDSNPPVAARSDVLILAVKPQNIRQVLEQLRPSLTTDHLVISIAAGVTIGSIVDGLGPTSRVVRVMPNTPALVGEGASAYAIGPGVGSEDESVVKAFLNSVGHAVCVSESMLDAVTGFSGSGPADWIYRDDRSAFSDWSVLHGAAPERGPTGPWRRRYGCRQDGSGNGPAPGCAQGSGCLTRRNDHRGPACASASGSPRCLDRCG